MQTSEQVQKLSAEALGTFILVTLGCGAAVMTGADIAATGLTFGIAVLIGVYAFGRISGGHFNPAVTVGAAVSGRFPWAQVPLYVGAQLVGAIVGGLVLWVLFHGIPDFDATGNMGQNGFGDHGSGYAWWAAFLLELVLTAFFVYVILGVTDERNEHPALAPLAIGLALAAIHFVAIPATGTSVNPARSIGPALFAGVDHILQLWLFILAPLVGAVIAGVSYPLLFGRAAEPVPGSGLHWGARAVAVPGYGAPDAFQQQWNQEDATGVPGITGDSSTTAATGATAGDTGATTTTPMETGTPDAAGQPPRIIQDGWEWDYAAQQWKPLQEPPAEG